MKIYISKLPIEIIQKSFLTSCLLLIGSLVCSQEYVGSKQCIACHKAEYEQWQGSHHDMAMRHVDSQSVLGDFNNSQLKLGDKTNRFFKKDQQYWVNIEGPDGKFQDYQIQYTFGYEPLQQYMVEFDDGRVQLIPFAWDSRTKEAGGQHWFNLYPEFTKPYQSFYWTNTGQNWNFMCADCHSTNVSKNYDLSTDSYNTQWSEINVGCEACHGPATKHIEWSKTADPSIPLSGFNLDLGKAVTQWLDSGEAILKPDAIHKTDQEKTCAQCHSRRLQISEESLDSNHAFSDRYQLNLLGRNEYYPDGQIYDEAYVYGSFLQSKMHSSGVSCSNCHNPHTAKLQQPKETLCLQCHKPTVYQQPSHHKHKENSTGAQCVNCHMPETTYMQIDSRADHSWPIPRPDEALKFGTPDTCLNCHSDKDSPWSLQQVIQWYPNSKVRKQATFTEAFTAANFSYSNASTQLTSIAQDKNYPDIVRASALQRMAPYPDGNSFIAIARAVKDPNDSVRLGAVLGAQNLPLSERWQLLEPLLKDKSLAIRAQAAQILSPLWQQLNSQQQALLQPALDDYFKTMEFNADRGFSHTNKGNIYTQQGQLHTALVLFDQSIRIEPSFAGAYIAKADVYRLQGDEGAALKTLQQGIKAQPEDSTLPYSLGLALIRGNQRLEASKYFKLATELAPNNAGYQYVYGLSLEQSQPTKAMAAIRTAYTSSSNPQHLFALCDMQVRQKSFQAWQCINELSKVAPANVIEQLEERLKNKQ
jgi:predicted CXXCH cytochrome family protein